MIYRLSYIGLLILFCLNPSAFSKNFEGIKISSITVSAPSEDMNTEDFESLVKPLEGTPFSSHKINALLKTLYLTEKFHNILVHIQPFPEHSPTSVKVSFVLELRKQIALIEFDGNSAFSDSFLQKSLKLKLGGLFSDSDIEHDRHLIQELYENQGYFQSKVQVRFSSPKSSHEISVLFDIQEGSPCVIEKLMIESIGKPKSKSIQRLLSLEPGDVYRPDELKAEIQKLKEYFFKHHHLSTVFYPENIQFNKDRSQVRISLKIKPGPQFSFEFKGNHEFSSYELLYPLLYAPDSGYTVSIEEISNHIVDQYLSDGFQHVQVTFKTEFDEKLNKKTAFFLVNENEPVQISHFTIVGNQFFDKNYYQDLLWRLASSTIRHRRYNPKDVEDLAKLLTDHLKTKGFLFPKITLTNINWDAKKLSVSPEFQIEEGPQTRIQEIRLTGNHAFSRDQLLQILDIPSGQSLDPTLLDSFLTRIIQYYRERGYLMFKIENMGQDSLVQYSTDLKSAYLDLRLSEGPQIRIGEVIFRGIFRTRSRVLERELSFQKGEPWNPTEIDKTEGHLSKLGLFSSVKIRPLHPEFKEGENDILIDVSERMPGLTELGGGFKTDDGFHAFSGVAYRNLGGWNRALSLRGEVNRKINAYRFLERDAELGLSEPYLFTIPFIARFNVVHKKEASLPSDKLSWEAKVSLDKILWDYLKLALQYNYEYRDIFRAIDIRDVQDQVIASLGPSLFLDFRDDPFNPKNGSAHTISTSLFLPELDPFFKRSPDKEASFTRTLASSNWYYTPWSWLTYALSLRAGYANAHSQKVPIPVDKRFYLGGRSSIRGFREDIIGSDTKNKQIFDTSFVNYKMELQCSLLSGVGLAGFFDGGNVFFDSPVSGNHFRYSVGPGLRYETPIGPLSLDYGFILARNRNAGEPLGRFHLAIGLF